MEPTAVRDLIVEVQVNVEAASHERGSSLELSSTSNSSSSSNSSPNLSDQSLPIEASATLAGNPSGVCARVRPLFLPRAQAMQGLMTSSPHATIWQQLKKSDKRHQRDAIKHKKRVRRLSKEMYMIVSMYALLQGVLFVAVAQSTAFKCEDRWGPAGIAGGVTLGTLCSVVDKLLRMGHHKKLAKRSERCQSAVYDKIELLYSCGSECPIDENLDPQISSVLPSSPALLCLRGLLVLGFLMGFSLLVIASCTSMLCHSHPHLV